MNEALVAGWNDRVRTGDIVYHLGDVAEWRNSDPAQLDRLLSRLHGQRQLIFGNHDYKNKAVLRSNGWSWMGPYKKIKYEGQEIVLFHYAMRVWDKIHWGTWQLYGHSHGNLPRDPNLPAMDVGVDSWQYKPISFWDVHRELSQIKYNPVDHHTAEKAKEGK